MQVGVIGARNLLGKNSGGLSNPYCTTWVTNKGHKLKEKTPVSVPVTEKLRICAPVINSG
jgi:hypothetical protein